MGGGGNSEQEGPRASRIQEQYGSILGPPNQPDQQPWFYVLYTCSRFIAQEPPPSLPGSMRCVLVLWQREFSGGFAIIIG